VKLATHIRHQG